MAGDLDIREVVVAAAPPTMHEEHADRAQAAGLSDPSGARVLHRYGRVIILGATGPVGAQAGAAGAPDLGPIAAAEVPDRLTELTDTEALGLSAFRLRESTEYAEAKRNRPRQGEEWDIAGCVEYGPPGEAGAFRSATPAGAAPTSAYLEGSVAVGIVIVEGPTAALQFTAAERTKVVAEVQNGLGFHAMSNPAADISFSYDVQVVRIAAQPNPGAADLEALWRDPAMGALGYGANWTGVGQYVEHLRTSLGTRWTYCGFFTKYPLNHFAYATIGGPRLVMDYNNDGWGPDNIDRVFAHESGHIFGCPDEYAASGCTCGGSWGRFGTSNANCQNCAPGGGVACLMKVNDFQLCAWTPSHLGWAKGVSANPVLRQSRFGIKGNFELAAPSAFSGIDFMWRNNDVPSFPWSAPSQFAQALGHVGAISMIQSNFGSPGNLELVARAGSTLQFLWRDSGPAFGWSNPGQIATGATGNPVLLQSRFGKKGNFELAFPLAAGGIGFMWRNNDDPKLPWSGVSSFGAGLGKVDGIALIESNFGSPGNLELIAQAGGKLYAFWRDSGPAFHWNGPSRIL